jgi:hypothetical protein
VYDFQKGGRMAKAEKVAGEIVAEACNTFLTTGFHLEDLNKLKTLVFDAVRNYKASGERNWPGLYMCSHCNQQHSVSPESIRQALFKGPGAPLDFSAAYDEFAAILSGMPAADAGYGDLNGFNGNSDAEISHIIDPSLKPEEVTSETESKDNDGSSSSESTTPPVG